VGAVVAPVAAGTGAGMVAYRVQHSMRRFGGAVQSRL
jgi:hypothetical protein